MVLWRLWGVHMGSYGVTGDPEHPESVQGMDLKRT